MPGYSSAFGININSNFVFFSKIKFKHLFIITFISIILYSPWVIRNYQVFDKIILTKTHVWQNVHFGYFEET